MHTHYRAPEAEARFNDAAARHENVSGDVNGRHTLKLPWPARSLERRRVFQEVYQLFFQQVFHGCGNPACKTPTCASQRRKRSKGPFRPYTVSTARAIAVHLTSQDHPSKKLCPDIESKFCGADSVNIGATKCAASKHDPLNAQAKLKKESLALDHTLLLEKQSLEAPGTPSSAAPASKKHSKIDHETNASTLEEQSTQTVGDSSIKQQRCTADGNPGLDEVGYHGSLIRNIFRSKASDLLLGATPSERSERYSCSVKAKNDDSQFEENDPLVFQEHRDTNNTNNLKHDALDTIVQRPDKLCEMEAGPDGPKVSKLASGKKEYQAMIYCQLPRSFPSKMIYRQYSGPLTEFCEVNDPQGRHFLPIDIDHLFNLSLFGNDDSSHSFVEKWGMLKKHKNNPFWTHMLHEHLCRSDYPIGPYWCTRIHHDQPIERAINFYQALTNMFCSSQGLLEFFARRYLDEATSSTPSSNDFTSMVWRMGILHGANVYPFTLLQSLWQAMGSIYIPRSVHSKVQYSSFDSQDRMPQFFDADNLLWLNDTETAQMVQMSLAALVASILPSISKADGILQAVQRLRKYGHVVPPVVRNQPAGSYNILYWTMIAMDDLDSFIGLSIMNRLCSTLAYRNRRSKDIEILDIIIYSLVDSPSLPLRVSPKSENLPSSRGQELTSPAHPGNPELMARNQGPSVALRVVVEWLRGMLLREWDGSEEISRCSALGVALALLSKIYDSYSKQLIPPEDFETPFVSERLNMLDTPSRWVKFSSDTKAHILDFPFLFDPSTLVSYFRAISHHSMSKFYNKSQAYRRDATELSYPSSPDDSASRGHLGENQWLTYLRELYLVLVIRREAVLPDAFDQLWRRKKSELLRPLKVFLGSSEGELGMDHGGVQQEFFQVAFAEALNDSYGAFNTDPQTHMTWFQPRSLEPTYKFELLGLLMSLAIYNGISLPVTFPSALYMKLLNREPDRLEDIEDGWPFLSRSLRILRDWKDTDGDVQDVVHRTYTFPVQAFGTHEEVDMASSASESSSQATPMVTNANRIQYVKDYIRHLTSISVTPQYEAFAKGFRTVVDPKWLSLFTPSALKQLVEGIPRIDTHRLERITKYENGYHANHPNIKTFWSVVHEWASTSEVSGEPTTPPARPSQNQRGEGEEGQTKVRKLLEFVTASDRLPVGGEERVQFIVQMEPSDDDARLPTSMTCYGHLMLPEYPSQEVMKERLERAIEHSKGFGNI